MGVVYTGRQARRIQALTARAWRGILAPAEPSSDTPVVLLPGMWSGLPGQVLKPACLKLQAASALTSPHSSAGGGFSVPAGFSRDRWRRRNHLQLRRLVVCFQRHLQAHDPGPPSAPLAGDFLFQVAASAVRSAAIGRKGPEVPVWRCLPITSKHRASTGTNVAARS